MATLADELDALAERQRDFTLTQIMEVMRMHETYYTPEHLAQLEARREEFGSEQIAAIEHEWAELSAQMKAHREAGTDPSDPEVRALAERGGRPRRSLDRRRRPRQHREPWRMYKEEGPEEASRGTFDADRLSTYPILFGRP